MVQKSCHEETDSLIFDIFMAVMASVCGILVYVVWYVRTKFWRNSAASILMS
jgi:hypothetical protein